MPESSHFLPLLVRDASRSHLQWAGRPRSQTGPLRYLAVLLTAILGTLASAGMFLLIQSWEHQVAVIGFNTTAHDRLRIITTDFVQSSNLLRILQAYLESADQPVSRHEYTAFSKALHTGIAGLRDTGWAPRIPAADRAAFELRMQLDHPGFEIREVAAGRLVRAGDRAEYFPILYIEGNPLSGGLLGLDLAFEPVRRAAIARTVETGRPAATPPISLATVPRVRGGLMSFLTVAANGASSSNGVVLGAFDIAVMIDNIVASGASIGGLDLYFFEPDAHDSDPPIYARRTIPSDAPLPTRQALLAGTAVAETVLIMDQRWTAIVAPALVPAVSWRWYAIVPPAIGLVMTMMTAAWLLISVRRTVQLEALTTDLRRTTDSLHDTVAQVTHLARHDVLTALPNRSRFTECIAEAVAGLAEAGAGGHDFALLCLDLDRFKSVNDTYGHAVGDALLRAAADRMDACLRRSDVLARLGGDEFSIILDHPDEAAGVAERLVGQLSRPYEIEGHRVEIGVSIGIAIAPRDGMLAETLQRRADAALYAAKQAGRGGYRFVEDRPATPLPASAEPLG